MYEPNNSDAKQYVPLIDYMLSKQESPSSSSSDDDDTSGRILKILSKINNYMKLFLFRWWFFKEW